MGILDWLTGRRPPLPGVAPVPPAQLRQALLEINRPGAPFQITQPREAGPADLIAEWKIVDARWYEIFAKTGLSKTHRLLLRLDEARHELRCVQEEWEVSWRAGIPELRLEASYFRGQKVSFEAGAAYGFTEELRPGVIYRYRFSTGELKGPLQEVTARSGWTWRAVAMGRL